jgi:hypothetical protein
VPALGESMSGFSVPDTWIGVLGPKSLPLDVAAKLNGAIVEHAVGKTTTPFPRR